MDDELYICESAKKDPNTRCNFRHNRPHKSNITCQANCTICSGVAYRCVPLKSAIEKANGILNDD